MKYIQKNLKNEPASLKEKRSTPGAAFDDCNKDDIRKALLKEQGSICAYCMQRIDNTFDEKGLAITKIEHYQAKSGDNLLQLNYLNMLAVCRGNEGEAKHLQHCDTAKANSSITVNPMKTNCESQIGYESSGEIFSVNKTIHKDLVEVLKLNNQRLVELRKEAIKTARIAMMGSKGKKQTWSESDLKAEIKRWLQLSDEKYEPFCMAAVNYLQRKIARLP